MLVHLPLILKNSVRNKRRSMLTLLSIAASLCLLGLMMALWNAFFLTGPTEEQALRLIVRNRVSLANPLPMSYEARIAQVPGVEEVMIYQWFGGTYKDSRDPANFFGRFAVEPEKMGTIFPEFRMPDEQRKSFVSERTAAIVGKKTADRLGMKIGDKVTLVGDIFPVTLELTIRGIYESERDNESLFFSQKYLNEGLPSGYADMVGAYSIRLDRAEDAGPVAEAVDGMFRNSPMETKTETEKAFELSFLAFLGNVKAFLLAICGAVTFTVLLVAGNTMAMSVRERIREVGVLKTLGYTPGAILGLILGEAVALSVAGGLLGLVFAEGLCALIRSLPSTFADLSRIGIPAPVWALCLGVAALIGVVSSVVPAWGASKRTIVEALRYSG